MKKIAIDVVLFPSKELNDLSIKASKDIISSSNDNTIELNNENSFPHVSLAMLVIDENDFDKIIKEIESIINDFSSIKTEIISIDKGKTPEGDIVSGFKLKNSDALQSLHEKIMETVFIYSKGKSSLDSLYQIPKPSKSTCYWVDGYKDTSSYEKFNPHITLAFGDLNSIPKVGTLSLDRISICHVGIYCTCRKIFWEKKLK